MKDWLFLRLARKKEYHCYKTKNNVRYRFLNTIFI